jgi:hypothetical protein
VQLLNLRYLTRHYESLSKMCVQYVVQTKLQFQAVLDQVFPAYKGVFGAMYSGVLLRFLKSFPTSYSILQTDKETLNAKIKELLSSRRQYAAQREFYDRKRAEGKPNKVALVACQPSPPSLPLQMPKATKSLKVVKIILENK